MKQSIMSKANWLCDPVQIAWLLWAFVVSMKQSIMSEAIFNKSVSCSSQVGCPPPSLHGASLPLSSTPSAGEGAPEPQSLTHDPNADLYVISYAVLAGTLFLDTWLLSTEERTLFSLLSIGLCLPLTTRTSKGRRWSVRTTQSPPRPYFTSLRDSHPNRNGSHSCCCVSLF